MTSDTKYINSLISTNYSFHLPCSKIINKQRNKRNYIEFCLIELVRDAREIGKDNKDLVWMYDWVKAGEGLTGLALALF